MNNLAKLIILQAKFN